MSTSVTEMNARSAALTVLAYVVAALACAIFGAVYEMFSHEVYSASMIYAFLFPLAGGALPLAILSIKRMKRKLKRNSLRLYHFGIATLTVGSIVKGILDIYGTTNKLLSVYWYVGTALALTGFILSIIDGCRHNA